MLHDARTVRLHEEFAMQYEANDQPHSATWLELDETERVDAVMDYHRRAKLKLENLELHAMTLWWSKTKLRSEKRRRSPQHSTG